ncbi:unnamed protein product [Lasius platythorax]|uniref:Uncharacterized protein n=1 Tax=Lasius platythorax TaxID=488582 RepID=A0AAV2MYV4_9HYME
MCDAIPGTPKEDVPFLKPRPLEETRRRETSIKSVVISTITPPEEMEDHQVIKGSSEVFLSSSTDASIVKRSRKRNKSPPPSDWKRRFFTRIRENKRKAMDVISISSRDSRSTAAKEKAGK